MEEFFRVGVVTTTHGVHGEMKVFPTTEDASRFKKLKSVIADTKKGRIVWEIESVKFFKQFVILKVKGIDDMDQAALYRNTDLLVARADAIPLKENEYYVSDIIGLTVITDEGKEFGKVVDVLQTGANDCYEVEVPGMKNTVLLPAIRQCILDVQPEKGCLIAHIMEGLL